MPEASTICDRVTIINQGKVVTTDTPTELQSQLESSFGYEVETAGDLRFIIPLLQKVPGVINITSAHSSLFDRHQHHLLKLTCQPVPEVGKDIARAIITQGLDLYELRRTSPSLEDIFLKLTTEETLEITER